MGNHQANCEAVAGASFGTALGGIALMVFGGPPGIVAGSGILGAGLSGGMNAIQQRSNQNEEFKVGEFMGSVFINGTIGAVTAGAGAAFQGARTAVQIGACAGTGLVANGGGKIVTNIIEDKPILQDAGTAAIAGAVGGGVASSLGLVGQKAANGIATNISSNLTKQTSKTIANVAIKTASSASTAAATGATSAAITELMNFGEIDKQGLYQQLFGDRNDEEAKQQFEELWEHFDQNGKILFGKLTLKKTTIEKLPPSLQIFKQSLLKILEDLTSGQKILSNIGKAATMSAVVGGTVGFVSHSMNEAYPRGKFEKESKPLDVKKYRTGQPKMAPPGQKPSMTAGDLNNKELNQLYNKKVVSVTPIERPMDVAKGKVTTGLTHKASLVTLEDGTHWLIEKGGTYAKDGSFKTIIKNANNLGSKMGWREGQTTAVKGNVKVHSLMKAANEGVCGRNYNVLLDNCAHAQMRVLQTANNDQEEPAQQDVVQQ